jgi:transcriptional regulator with XRE-family HTH domain
MQHKIFTYVNNALMPVLCSAIDGTMEKITDQQKFIDRLRDHMVSKGLSQAALARAAEISPSVLSMYFSGTRTPNREALMRLANVLDCSVDYLIGRNSKSDIEDLVQQEKIQDLIAEFSALSVHDQKRIMDMIRLLRSGTLSE